MKKAVYFFCNDLSIDPVSIRVFNQFKEKVGFTSELKIEIDGFSVLEYIDEHENCFQFVRINEVLSHNYIKYLPIINQYFADFDFAGIVNWHEGAGGADKILCAHTTGDVKTGIFGPANPIYFRNLMNAIEDWRNNLGLIDFFTTTEATHWSGVLYNQPPELLLEFQVPIVDIEVGSIQESWENEIAAEVLAHSLIEVFKNINQVPSVICVGGIHFTQAYAIAIQNRETPYGISHILSNIWLEQGMYNDIEIGKAKLKKSIESIQGGVDAIAFHGKMKSGFKNTCKEIAIELGIPVFKKKNLLKPDFSLAI